MSRRELEVWLILLTIVGLPALIGWLIPNGWLLMAVMYLFCFLLMLAIPVFIYLMIAFGLNLLIARLHPAFRLLVTCAALVIVMMLPSQVLNLDVDARLSRLTSADRIVALDTTPQSIAIYSADARTYCDQLCTRLLLNRQVRHVDVANAMGPVTPGMPADQATRRYSLETRADCPSSYTKAYTSNYGTVPPELTEAGRYFQMTGACLMQSTGQLVDNDIVVVKEARLARDAALSKAGDVSVDIVYQRTAAGFREAGQQTYYSLKKFMPVFIPMRPGDLYSDTAGHLELASTWKTKHRPSDDATWIGKDLGIRFPAANPMSIQPLRARVILELSASNSKISPNALEAFKLFRHIVVSRNSEDYPEQVRDSKDDALVKRIDKQCSVLCR